MAETFEHKPEQWTVGQLREALKDLPDDTPLHVGVPDSPGDFDDYQEMVAIDVEPVELLYRGYNGKPDRTEVRHTLFVDFPADTYNRPEK
ncbi:DUF6225 family protein [Streptomyces tanashiensis]|uniref:DUF6225 family protein n=1 Tax=Streptomyces tanashiensis TaxID=67367 RepID=UPI0036F037AC